MRKFLFILFASTTFAALPPLAQSTKELKALLSDPRFYSSLGSSERIREILRTETGYIVTTEHYVMEVDIHYGGVTKVIGPIPFQFEFHPPESRSM